MQPCGPFSPDAVTLVLTLGLPLCPLQETAIKAQALPRIDTDSVSTRENSVYELGRALSARVFGTGEAPLLQ